MITRDKPLNKILQKVQKISRSIVHCRIWHFCYKSTFTYYILLSALVLTLEHYFNLGGNTYFSYTIFYMLLLWRIEVLKLVLFATHWNNINMLSLFSFKNKILCKVPGPGQVFKEFNLLKYLVVTDPHSSRYKIFKYSNKSSLIMLCKNSAYLLLKLDN